MIDLDSGGVPVQWERGREGSPPYLRRGGTRPVVPKTNLIQEDHNLMAETKEITDRDTKIALRRIHRSLKLRIEALAEDPPRTEAGREEIAQRIADYFDDLLRRLIANGDPRLLPNLLEWTVGFEPRWSGAHEGVIITGRSVRTLH